ncbi:FliM/FliN family flagellar motor switch protein [Roseinatronobacter sp.]
MAEQDEPAANPQAPDTAEDQTRAAPLAEAFPSLNAAEGATNDTQSDMRPPPKQQQGRNIDAMLNVDLRVQVILGHTRMPISQLLKLSRGSVIELDRRIGEAVDLVINDRLVARGDLVKLDGDKIGIALAEIVKDYVLDT